jgi:hypothetical protein
LRVDGETTTVNSTTVELGDNIIVLNSGEDAAPSADAGLEINRGTSDPVSLLWNETTDRFEITDENETYVVGRKYVKLIGSAQINTNVATITHNLNSQDVVVSLREVAGNQIVYATYEAATANTVTITFASAPAEDAFIATIIG